jgi:hypothetical protein
MMNQEQSESSLTDGEAEPRRVVFLHIVKTAGTSLVEYLRNRLPVGSVLSHGDFLEFPDEKLPPARMSEYRLISGHFGYTHIREYLPGSYSVTILREPIARVLSLYKYCLNADMQKRFAAARIAATLTVDEFMTSTRPEVVEMLDNQQTWQLADTYWTADRQRQPLRSNSEVLELAKTHLQEFSLVGFTDTFAADFRKVVLAMGLPEPGHVPRQLRTINPIVPENLKDSTLATLKDRMALDYELLAYARRLSPGTGSGG